MSMELVMKTDLAKALPQAIEFNYEELKKQLPERLTYYKNLVVTEDSIKSAKGDKSTLNKLRTAFEDARKDVKRDCLKPYEDFERKEKELVGMIDEAIQSIDGQVKTFDENRAVAKKEQINAFYLENVGDLGALLPFEKIYNLRWLNTTYKMADVEKEITDTIFKVKNDIQIIKTFGVACEQQMLDKYLATLDMSAAMAEKTRWEDQQKKMAEYEENQRKAAEQQKQSAPQVIETTFTEPKAQPEPPQSYIPEPEDCPEREMLKTISVTFHDTPEEFRHEMGALCRKYGIKYGWTKKEDIE